MEAKTKILIVEDESIIALDIKKSLLKAGYIVLGVAASAVEALDQVKQLQPDLVLMDVQLQGEMDGIETAARIKECCNIPVVYLTAHADENTLSRAKRTAPFGYVLKPFEDRELTTAIDIALHRHQAEEQIRKALHKEQELHDLKSRFISIVSHEFRNPLSTIQFSAEMLERYQDQMNGDKQSVHLQRIRTSIQRMRRLLDDVLMLEQVDAGKLQFEPAPIPLALFCQELIDEIRISHPDHAPIQLLTEPALDPIQPPPLANLDERLLRHILTNLLSNAVKYSPKHCPIELHAIQAENQVILQVCDQGIGIPAAEQSQLFNSFYRASNVNAVPGNGLGLSIVKQCVETHGGQIAVQSEIGIGTTFTVVLPIAP